VHQPFYKMKKQGLQYTSKKPTYLKETKPLSKHKRHFRLNTNPNPCSLLVNQSQYSGMPLTMASYLKTNTSTTQKNQNYYTRK